MAKSLENPDITNLGDFVPLLTDDYPHHSLESGSLSISTSKGAKFNFGYSTTLLFNKDNFCLNFNKSNFTHDYSFEFPIK